MKTLNMIGKDGGGDNGQGDGDPNDPEGGGKTWFKEVFRKKNIMEFFMSYKEYLCQFFVQTILSQCVSAIKETYLPVVKWL